MLPIYASIASITCDKRDIVPIPIAILVDIRRACSSIGNSATCQQRRKYRNRSGIRNSREPHRPSGCPGTTCPSVSRKRNACVRDIHVTIHRRGKQDIRPTVVVFSILQFASSRSSVIHSTTPRNEEGFVIRDMSQYKPRRACRDDLWDYRRRNPPETPIHHTSAETRERSGVAILEGLDEWLDLRGGREIGSRVGIGESSGEDEPLGRRGWKSSGTVYDGSGRSGEILFEGSS